MSLKTNIWFIRALVIGLNWLKFDNSRLDWLNQKHGQNWRLKTNAWANIGLSHVFLSTSNINYFYFVPCSASSSLMSLYFRLLWWILPWIKHWNSCKSLPVMQEMEKSQKNRLCFGSPWRHPTKRDDPTLCQQRAKLQLLDFVQSLVNTEFGVTHSPFNLIFFLLLDAGKLPRWL